MQSWEPPAAATQVAIRVLGYAYEWLFREQARRIRQRLREFEGEAETAQ